MRKIVVFTAIAVVSLLGAVTLLLTSASPSQPAKVGQGNFACVAAWNLVGFCIGPPTR